MMRYDPDIHHRRSIRLRDYDYTSAGAYFVTVVIHGRECLLGEVVGGEMRLNDAGRMVQMIWEDLVHHYPALELDAFAIMPNHVHGIIILHDSVGAGLKPAPTKRYALPEIVRGFKTFSSRRINLIRHMPGTPVWQRNYYEHIIRDDDELNVMREYVTTNPLRWDEDEENPLCVMP